MTDRDVRHPPVPPALHSALGAQLAPGEQVLAWLDTDLDDRLRFAAGWVVLTDRQLLARGPHERHWRAWPRGAALGFRLHDHAGAAELALLEHGRRSAAWRFTLGRLPTARRLVEVNGLPPGESPLPPAGGEDAGGGDSHTAPASLANLLRLRRFAQPYRGALLLGFLLTLGATAATLVPPYLTMPLMDRVLVPYGRGVPIDWPLVGRLLAALFAAAASAWALGWARTFVLAKASERIGADLRTATYQHLLGLSLDYFGSRRTGDLMSRIGAETDRICLFLSMHLLDFATDVLMIAMTAAILLSIDPGLALAALLPLPLIAWLIHQVRDRLRRGFEKVDRVWGEVNNVLADTIPGIRVVKAFAQEARETGRFREANRHNLAVNDRVNFTWALFGPTVTLLTEAGLLVVWAVGIWRVAHDTITVGVLTAFLAYIGRFYTRLDSMSRFASFSQKAAAGAKRVFEVLDHVSSVPEPARPAPLPAVRGRIELRGVGLRYGSRAVLRGIHLTVQPGEMIGLVGHSGAGKSTLVNVICRFHDPSEGVVLLDGLDARTLRLADYRRQFGVVLQEPFLFYGTVAENIAYGRPEASRAQVVAAARAAHAHEAILRLPQGYDSLVGERGQALSGGERQRVSIARALLVDPPILVLDEATSSVDTETEKEIQKALDNLVRGRTTIAIAHRLSTLRRADRLVVLERGEMVEQGSHDALMAREGAYFRLYQAQARNAGGSPVETAPGAGELALLSHHAQPRP